ncbi:MAG: type II secretion system secretin GspD [Burkholderiales bacterium]
MSLLSRCLPIGVLCAVVTVCAGLAHADDKDLVTVNFVNADIEGVVKAVSKITGKDFVLDPRVKGTVNVVSSTPISRERVYEVFLAALRLQGFAAIDDDGVVKIVPANEAKTFRSIGGGAGRRAPASGDEIETRIFTLKYESAAQALQVLRPLIAPGNSITAANGSNALIVTDYASNLKRIEWIAHEIDQPAGNGPIVIPLRYASALDLAQSVGQLFGGGRGGTAPGAGPGGHLTVLADARSNSLLASSDNSAQLARLRDLVAVLDSPTSAAGNIHVVYLKNAQAVEVAKTLRAIYTGTSQEGGGQTSSSQQAPQMRSLAPASTSSSGATGGMAGTSSGSPTPQGQGPTFGASDGGEGATAPGIIQADTATNALIISAPDAIYNSLRAAIEKLDIRRKEVYVKALIAEVTSDRAAEFGVQWQSLNGASSGTASGIGGTNFGTTTQNIQSFAQNPTAAGTGLNVGVVKGVVTIPGISGQVLNIELLVRALDTDSSANILSTPSLLTVDNQVANIVVGQNVPFITGQYAVTGSSTTPTPFQTIERQDVGLTLAIKPQITDGGIVRLHIYAEVSSIQDKTNPAGIITNKRSVESTVLVNDGQIIVIGGLIQDSVTTGVQKVPLLGDLPLLGGLFRYDTRERSKTNLMVFLQPTIVRDAEQADKLTGDRYDYMLGEQKKQDISPSSVLPQMWPPVLPSLERRR